MFTQEQIGAITRAVGTWLEVLRIHDYGAPTSADASHSALLRRLLSGKEPLPIPPPKA